ncbi:hypothetical protein AMTR_s00013p00097410 [Amborella trichopoda]|uniref:Uncharacterized protein n=1 Tax=Amborella trichopoda TaxID=13333 RepID=W1PP81_AMBTC|nr:hypothetical protein AMTR_s00013p00097410 [Amborella trichopoda]
MEVMKGLEAEIEVALLSLPVTLTPVEIMRRSARPSLTQRPQSWPASTWPGWFLRCRVSAKQRTQAANGFFLSKAEIVFLPFQKLKLCFPFEEVFLSLTW